jgi:hypothetical protein
VSLIHNERTKLTAGLFNGLAVAFLAAGLFAPAAALAYGISNLRIGAAYLAPLILVCVVGARDPTLGWTGSPWEVGRMTFDQFLFILMGPAFLLLFVPLILAMTRWQDRREIRRRAENRPPRFGIDYL